MEVSNAKKLKALEIENAKLKKLLAELGYKTPIEARASFEQFESSARNSLAQNETEEYEIRTHKLSTKMREPRGAGRKSISMLGPQQYSTATRKLTGCW